MPYAPGRLFGGCKLPRFHARYVQRHNAGVKILYDTIAAGASGGVFCIMNACPAASLAPDFSDTRLPDWLLPHVPPAEHARFRPTSSSSLASLTSSSSFCTLPVRFLNSEPMNAVSLRHRPSVAAEAVCSPVCVLLVALVLSDRAPLAHQHL